VVHGEEADDVRSDDEEYVYSFLLLQAEADFIRSDGESDDKKKD
jgi:hypothetical protein